MQQEPKRAQFKRPVKMAHKVLRKVLKSIMISYKFKLPNYDLPVRFRPWFLCATAVIMITLAFLGFTNFSRSLPINDKILHFVCLCLATGVFYFIFDVEEEARRIWIWRYSSLIFTGIVCFFFGGIVSEFVQSLLPYKQFQIGDVAANLTGSSVGLWTAFYLERYYRYRREISRLYRPISLDPDSPIESEGEDDLRETALLPLYRTGGVRGTDKSLSKASKNEDIHLGDIWDEREELFGIGESDNEDENTQPHRLPPPREHPTIVVTSS